MENQKEKEFSYVSVKLLEEVGLLPALLLQNIIYRCNRYKQNNNELFYHDNIFWDIISVKQIQQSLPIKKGTSQRQISRSLDKLEEKNFIKKKNLNYICNMYAPTEKVKELLGDEYNIIENDDNLYCCNDYKFNNLDFYIMEMRIEEYKRLQKKISDKISY